LASPPPHWEDIKATPEFQGAQDFEKRVMFYKWQHDHTKYMRFTGAGLTESERRQETAYFDRQLQELDLAPDLSDKLYTLWEGMREGANDSPIMRAINWGANKTALSIKEQSEKPGAGVGTRALLGIAQGAVSTNQAVDVINLKSARAFHSIFGVGQSEAVERFQRDILTDVQTKQTLSGIGQRIGGGYVGDIAQAGGGAVTQLVPQVLVGASVTLATGNPAAGLGTSALFAGGQSFTDTYGVAFEKSVGNGVALDQAERDALFPATTAGLISGSITLAFGNTGVEKVFTQTGVQGVKAKLFEFLRQGGLEGLEELSDSVLNSANEKLTYNPDLTFSEALNDAIISATVGFGLGGTVNVITPGGHAHEAGPEAKPATKVNLGEEGEALVKNLMDTAGATEAEARAAVAAQLGQADGDFSARVSSEPSLSPAPEESEAAADFPELYDYQGIELPARQETVNLENVIKRPQFYEENQATIDEYSAKYAADEDVAPVVIFRTVHGDYVQDGNHRFLGARAAGKNEVSAIVVDAEAGRFQDGNLRLFEFESAQDLPKILEAHENKLAEQETQAQSQPSPGSEAGEHQVDPGNAGTVPPAESQAGSEVVPGQPGGPDGAASQPPPDPDIFTTDAEDLGEFEARQFSARSRELESQAEPAQGFEQGRVSSREIIRDMQTMLERLGRPTPIRVGRGMFAQRKATGFFDTRREVIRLQTANNIPTASHEVGHALEKLTATAQKPMSAEAVGELDKLGRALYGNRKPHNGYISEGFAEFARLYLTDDDPAAKAPHASKFFEEQILAGNDQLRGEFDALRAKIDTYRKEGALNRAKANQEKLPGRLAQAKKAVAAAAAKAPEAVVDELTPLLRLSRAVEARSGEKLAPSDDPYEMASWLRGSAPGRLQHMVFTEMVDFAGNKAGGSLADALAPIQSSEAEDFASYLWARRALERWSKGLNPGMSREDAQFIVDQLGSDRFQLAASRLYAWNNGILEYVKQAAPQMAPVIEKIQTNSKDYVPLARVFDDSETTETAKILAAGQANPLKGFKGSGRNIRDIIPTMIQNAEILMRNAHKRRVLDTIIRLEGKEGVGFMIEEVPPNMIGNRVAWDQLQSEKLDGIRDMLKASGVDLDGAMKDEVLTFFMPEQFPKGQDPIIPVAKGGKTKFYYVRNDLYEALNGIDLYRLPKVLDLFFGVPARLFRLGTTGLRPAFSLVTNPTRDIQSFILQSKSSNPKELFMSYLYGIRSEILPGKGQAKAFKDAFLRLGANLAQPLGADIASTRRAGTDVFKGKVFRTVSDPINAFREILSIPEAVPRIAEMKIAAERVGWDGQSPLTLDQAVVLANAAKRVTVDFSAAGAWGKKINQAIPFFNASVQGTRLFVDNVKNRPIRTMLAGLATLTLPTLATWWANKDEEWYKEMPDREKYLFWYVAIPGTETVLRIPRAFDYGNLFAVVPEALLNGWFQEDPEEVKHAFGQILDTVVPADYPVLLKASKEQWQNKVDFFDVPIVPRAELDMIPGDQRGPYTSQLAQFLGDVFPNQVSPRRIDAAVRAVTGGAGPDALNMLGLGTIGKDREWEPSDLPVIGTAFKRGGEAVVRSESIDKLFDAYSQALAVARSPRQEETPEQKQRRAILTDAVKAVRILTDLENATYGLKERAELKQQAVEIARDAIKP
jgi:hypothetical protein